MADNPQTDTSNPLDPSHPQHQSILNQKLGDVLRNNPHLQDRIIKSMNLTPEQFQQMLTTAGNNQYMNMTIGELFKSGFIQQAVQQSAQTMKMFSGQPGQGQAVQLTPEQLQQMMNNQNVQVMGQPVVVMQQQVQKPSFFQKLKGLFR